MWLPQHVLKPVLCKDAVQTLMGSHKARKSLTRFETDLVAEQIGIVTDVSAIPVDHLPCPGQPMHAGLLHLRHAPNTPTSLSCDAGLTATRDSLTFEAAMFPFLSPYGSRVYTPFYIRSCRKMECRHESHGPTRREAGQLQG